MARTDAFRPDRHDAALIGPKSRKISLALLFLLLSAFLAGSAMAAPSQEECARVGFENPEKLAAFVAAVREASGKNDKTALAGMIHYPLQVVANDKERTIADAATFLRRYTSIVTKDLRDILRKMDPNDLYIDEDGFMGLAPGPNPRLEISKTPEGPRITTIYSTY